MDNLTRTMLKRLVKDLRDGLIKTFSGSGQEVNIDNRIRNDIADEIEGRFRLLGSDDENVPDQRKDLDDDLWMGTGR